MFIFRNRSNGAEVLKKSLWHKVNKAEDEDEHLQAVSEFIEEHKAVFAAAVLAALCDSGDDISSEAVRRIMNRGNIESEGRLTAEECGNIYERMQRAFGSPDIKNAYEAAVPQGHRLVEIDVKISREGNQGGSSADVPQFDYASSYNRWCRQHTGRLIVQIDEQQQNNVKNIINDNVANKRSYQAAANEIRQTVGLTERQIRAVNNYRRTYAKNILKDNPDMDVAAVYERANQAADKYAQKQRQYRANNIARTELAKAQMNAALEYIKWGQDNGYFGPMHGEWVVSGNAHVCPICLDLEGAIVDLARDPLPPIHPQCACAIRFLEGFKESTFSDEMRDKYLDNSGNSGIINSERGISGKKIYNTDINKVDLDYISSKEYRDKFRMLPYSDKTNDSIYKYAKAMLTHRNGTNKEDMYLIDVHSGKLKGKQASSKSDFEVDYNKSLTDAVRKAERNTLVSLHNHPTELLPTGSDFSSMGAHGYHSGIVVCHDGRVYWYKTGRRAFSARLLDDRLKKYNGTNGYSIKNHERVLNEFKTEYGIDWRELK
ncbi:MAG: hypothetical protein Q4G33_04545 [bacterium]|nr:hypothetical protein [bacterium]